MRLSSERAESFFASLDPVLDLPRSEVRLRVFNPWFTTEPEQDPQYQRWAGVVDAAGLDIDLWDPSLHSSLLRSKARGDVLLPLQDPWEGGPDPSIVGPLFAALAAVNGAGTPVYAAYWDGAGGSPSGPPVDAPVHISVGRSHGDEPFTVGQTSLTAVEQEAAGAGGYIQFPAWMWSPDGSWSFSWDVDLQFGVLGCTGAQRDMFIVAGRGLETVETS